MITIDFQRLADALPKHAIVKLTRYNGRQVGQGSPCIEVKVPSPHLSQKDFEMCKKWLIEIVGEAFLENYTEEEGYHWFVYLKRVPIEFENVPDVAVNSWVGMDLLKDGKINRPL